MPDLIAQGTDPQNRWRRTLAEGQPVVLGRLAGLWATPWDPHISRRHAEIYWNGKFLRIRRLPGTRNPIFLRGREQESFRLDPGEHFVIGQTTFTLADQHVSVTAEGPAPLQQQSFSSQYLREVSFRNPDHRIEALIRLPEVITGATSDEELSVRLVSMLLAGAPRADAIAVVAADLREENARPVTTASTDNSDATIRVLHWDQRLMSGGGFQPSQKLILEAMRQRQSVLHVWRGLGNTAPSAFTECENYDWAFCSPVPGKTNPEWALYFAGRFNVDRVGVTQSSYASDLREDVKFAELAATMLQSLRQMRILERQHATLSQFFSPVVLETLSAEDPQVVLAPKETNVTVLFCDLRGFSRESERQRDDLLGLLNRVSDALGVMTQHIREQGGVVGDFQGDAALGFWGWPLPQPDVIERTCRAALGVREEFEATASFRAGIGIASGRAVAGKIGAIDQVKVTVFGPVVNLASRLEGMTKILRAPILIDQATAEAVRKNVSRDVARVRRLAVVKPYGLDTPVEVSELLPPASAYPILSDDHLVFYEQALDCFLNRQWGAALELLQRIPAEDEVKDFLTVYIAEHNRRPPSNWNGVIELENK